MLLVLAPSHLLYRLNSCSLSWYPDAGHPCSQCRWGGTWFTGGALTPGGHSAHLPRVLVTLLVVVAPGTEWARTMGVDCDWSNLPPGLVRGVGEANKSCGVSCTDVWSCAHLSSSRLPSVSPECPSFPHLHPSLLLLTSSPLSSSLG